MRFLALWGSGRSRSGCPLVHRAPVGRVEAGHAAVARLRRQVEPAADGDQPDRTYVAALQAGVVLVRPHPRQDGSLYRRRAIADAPGGRNVYRPAGPAGERRMAEHRHAAIGHRRDLPAVQRQAVRHEIDAVGVHVRRLHGVAEGQHPRVRTAQVAGRPGRRADGERDRGRATRNVHGHGAVEVQRDLDRLAPCVCGPADRRERRLDRLRPRRHPDRDIGGGGKVTGADDLEAEHMGPVLARRRRREGRPSGGSVRQRPAGTPGPGPGPGHVRPPGVVVAVLRPLDPEGHAPTRDNLDPARRPGLRGRHEARAAGIVVQRQAGQPRQFLENPRWQRREVVVPQIDD